MDFSVAVEAFGRTLDGEMPSWSRADARLTGPAGRLVLFDQRDLDAGERHVDVGIRLNQDDPGTELWDCASGMGRTHAEQMDIAARIWTATTGLTALEFWYSGHGRFADHFRGDDPDGFPGWHAIHSPVLSWGSDDGARMLKQWSQAHLLLRPLAGVFGAELDPARPHGFKIFFGGQDEAEVRVDGERHAAATDFLRSLDWPRIDPPGFVRFYVLLAHAEPA